MNPIIVPASTITTAGAGAVTTLIVWGLKQWGGVELPTNEAMALTTILSALACHFTTDSPPRAVAQAAVDVAAAKDDVQQKMDTAIAAAAASRLPTTASRMIVTDGSGGGGGTTPDAGAMITIER